MSLSELISEKRGDLQEAIEKTLAAELVKMGFQLDKVNLGASHLPAAIEAQMQQKMAAQQQAQQAEYELQKQQTLAKAEVARAQGDAQARLVRAEAEAKANHLLQASLTGSLVQYKSIEKWNGILPQVTGSNTPFIDLRK
jgi:regulator of protease activity HflC (stomatin/prohibitin superfamily)